jgi:hypothetical protein
MILIDLRTKKIINVMFRTEYLTFDVILNKKCLIGYNHDFPYYLCDPVIDKAYLSIHYVVIK